MERRVEAIKSIGFEAVSLPTYYVDMEKFWGPRPPKFQMPAGDREAKRPGKSLKKRRELAAQELDEFVV